MTRPVKKFYKKTIRCVVCGRKKVVYKPQALYCDHKCKKKRNNAMAYRAKKERLAAE